MNLGFTSGCHTRSACAKTCVRFSGTGRNLVRTCKPLTRLVHGTSSFLIRKNTATVENWLQITVELKFMLLVIKVNLMLDEIRFNIPFNFAILRPFHLFLRPPIGSRIWHTALLKTLVGSFLIYDCAWCHDIIFRFKSRTICKANTVIKRVKCPIVFEFRVLSKTFWTRTLWFRTTKFNIVLVRKTSG